jgi:spore germination protein GerM
MRFPRRRFIVVGLALVAAVLLWRSQTSHAPEEPPTPAAADSTGTGLKAVTLWFGSPGGDSLVAESREMPETAGLHARITALVAALEQGPREGGVRTIPEGTMLLHAYLDDAGLLTLDLSLPFRQGFRGGARAEEMTLGSLVRTLAANVPEIKRIRIVCGGVALPTLGGHFPLDQPLDVDEWP